MILKEMIELIQQHHPSMGEIEIRKALNRAADHFCAETEIVKMSFTQDTVVAQRYYTLDPRIQVVKDVYLDNVKIPRLVGSLALEDEDYS
jgi:hypothetical protein